MISIQCQCGQTLAVDDQIPARPSSCPQCGVAVCIACAEALPPGAADGDFDAMLVQRGGPALQAPCIALGGCAEIAIGRLAGSTIELPIPNVSRRHAKLIRIDFGPSRWKLADAGSAGGVFVNGQRIPEHELQPGDAIAIGDYRFEYILVAAPVAVPPLFPPAGFTQPMPAPFSSPARAPFPAARAPVGRGPVATGSRWTTGKIIAVSAAVVGVVLVVLALAILLPAWSAARSRAQGVLCSARLRQIGTACLEYQLQFGSYPPTLGDLAAVPGISPTMFICPADSRVNPSQAPTDRAGLAAWINQNTSFTYCGPAFPGGIAIYEKPGQHEAGRANVYLLDGAVNRLTAADLQTRLAVTAVSPSPVPSGLTPPNRTALGARRSLADARRAYKTTLTSRVTTADPVEQPPPNLFRIVKYDAEPGKLTAYLTPDPGDHAKHPAIIWITGGDSSTIGDVWSPAGASNDQTAAAYRQAGIIMMFPSLRGGSGNPGSKEGFYGEVDDVLSAADYLATQTYVDPARIYLGGHSTGGTLALLVAECSDRFRAVFSFGPVHDVTAYGDNTVALPFDKTSAMETQLRAPGLWLEGIKTPTFIFEGEQTPTNKAALQIMASASPSPAARFYLVKGKSHFSILSPMNQVIAGKITRDTGPSTTTMAFTPDELPGLTPLGKAASAPSARP